MSNENEHYIIISVYMQLCEHSDYSNVISRFSVAPVKLLLLCTHVATLPQLLHKNILQAIHLRLCTRNEPPRNKLRCWMRVHSTMVGELEGEGGPERGQWWRMSRKLSNVLRVFWKNCVRWSREPWIPRMRQCTLPMPFKKLPDWPCVTRLSCKALFPCPQNAPRT